MKDPVAALGFDAMWPGPRLDVVEGDKIRAIFKNNLQESTGIHFHGQRLPNNMDGVPLITQDPIHPGDSFTYEFTARTTGSHMYHSHHNATDQVGRGLLGAFIVQPKDPAKRYDQLYGATQDIVWISNDSLGGFTINGRGFPATAPIVATLGEKIAIRFMNEGSMMHPWHLHGMPMHVVARDGYPLGSASFFCDTLGVNPGERWDVIVTAEEPGAWAFHCHILPHAEGHDGHVRDGHGARRQPAGDRGHDPCLGAAARPQPPDGRRARSGPRRWPAARRPTPARSRPDLAARRGGPGPGLRAARRGWSGGARREARRPCPPC